MSADELIMRGQTVSGGQETLNFGGRTPGYAYQITDLAILGSASVGGTDFEIMASVTADDTAEDPQIPNFNHPGLIATTFVKIPAAANYPAISFDPILNDLFFITQDLILMVFDSNSAAVNWQVKFRKVKLSASAEAVANFNQFTIYDG